MARIAGINLPTGKRVPVALTYIHGLGINTAVKNNGINPILNISRNVAKNNAKIITKKSFLLQGF